MVMEFVERGMRGKCCTFRMSGATFALSAELARPGVPLVLFARQFWPYWLGRFGSTNSRELPRPSAREDHAHPTWAKSLNCRTMIVPVARVAGVPDTAH